MKKKILIPTDFSKNSIEAIHYVIELFKNEACEFYILNCYNDLTFLTEAHDDEMEKTRMELLTEASEQGLQKISHRVSFRDESSQHDYVYVSENDDLLDAMTKLIELRDIELVVMGTKGTTNDFNIAFGSEAIRAMEKIRACPVLTIPSDCYFKEPNEIVFPTSFKTHFKYRELIYLIEIARITNAPIRILHVEKERALDDEQINYKNLLEEYFDGLEYSFHFMDNTSINLALHQFVQSRGSEMIAFINKKHTFFSSIFVQPLVKKIGDIKVPILALHDLRN